MLATPSSLLLIALLTLESCARPTAPAKNLDAFSPDERRSVAQLPIYNESELSGREYAVVTMVEGAACIHTRRDSGATEVEAIFQAKHVAPFKGAEGINEKPYVSL